MKIGIISDTHGNKQCMDEAISYLMDCDLIIHAGDNFSDSKYIHSVTKIGMMAVKGNCDFDNVEDELIFEIEDKNIFLCHGDKYGVKYDLEQLEEKAKEVEANIVIFGHTHTPLCIEKDNILYINPGSVSLPRNLSCKSMAILHIDSDNVKVEEIEL